MGYSDHKGAVAAKPKGTRKKASVVAPDESREALGPQDPVSRPGASWLWTGAKVLVGLAFVLALAGAVAYGARHFATTSGRFALRHLNVEGSTRFSEAQLLKLLGIDAGENLFSFDPKDAERKLLEHPWIASAKVTRKLPSTLKVEVEEYRAEASAAIGDTLYLVTRDGHPITELTLGESADYPVVTGVTLEDLAADRARALERVARGVEILRQYDRSSAASNYDAQEIHMQSDGSIQLVVGHAGITLMLGKGPVEQKLLMASRVLSKVRGRGETPTLIFLDNEAHPERVVVRLR